MTKSITLAWLIFLVALALVFAADYGLRMSDGEVRTGGLAVELQVALVLAAGLFCLYRAYLACKGKLKPALTVPLLLLMGAVGFGVYVVASWLYVSEAGLPL